MVLGVGVYVPYQPSGIDKTQHAIQNLLPERFCYYFYILQFFLQIFKGKGKGHPITCHEGTDVA